MQHTRKVKILCAIYGRLFFGVSAILSLHKKYPDRNIRGLNRSKDNVFFYHVLCLLGYSPGVKRPRSEVTHRNLVSTLRMSEWSSTSTPPICLRGVGMEKTLILHNKQIPWNMSDIENVATDDTE
jgi:hypothetical protein